MFVFSKNPSIIIFACAWWTICKPLKKHFPSVYFKMITCCTKSMISEGGGRGVIPTNRHVVLCYIFCFCFISIIVHLYWQEREREKKIRHVMCKKLEKPKHLRPEKKNFSISNSRVHVGQQWIKITTLQLLHNVTYPCCHHMIWKDRSIASAYKFLTQKK